jgi:Short C-terminal domain
MDKALAVTRLREACSLQIKKAECHRRRPTRPLSHSGRAAPRADRMLAQKTAALNSGKHEIGGTSGIRALIGLTAILLTAGCAHPIKVSPDVAKLERVSSTPPRVPATVGYYIPGEVSSVEVTTAGGGGDNIRYYPYTDIEPGFEKMLSNGFTGVVKLNSISDLPGIAHGGTQFIVQPVIVTSSGGSGLFTWPPTNFTVDLTCNVRDIAGALIASPRVVGSGSAETGERIRDHGFAGKRAMEDALTKMQAALLETRFRSGPTNGPATDSPSIVNKRGTIQDRLTELDELRAKGLITQAEYEAKRKAILDEF